MKKYVVICYSIHDRKIASHDTFNDEEEAYAFLKKDAQNTYEEEADSVCGDKEQIYFEVNDDGTAYLSSSDAEYEWTWEIIEV